MAYLLPQRAAIYLPRTASALLRRSSSTALLYRAASLPKFGAGVDARPKVTQLGITAYKQPCLHQPVRPFSMWKIPIYLATAGKAKRRLALLGTVSGITVIGALLGPVFWIILGGTAATVAWRVWRHTSRWWQLINNNGVTDAAKRAISGSEGLFSLLEKQVGNHRAADQVREATIDRIMSWSQTEEGRRTLVEHFNIDHLKDVTFFPTHASSHESRTTIANGHKQSMQQIKVQFWAEDDQSKGPRGGSCCVHAIADVDDQGNIQLQDIRLSAPGWHPDEHIPITSKDNNATSSGRVIEGEFRDV